MKILKYDIIRYERTDVMNYKINMKCELKNVSETLKDKQEELKKYYEKYDWYHPSIAPEDFSTDMFNDVERENIETMQRERDSRN